MGDKIDKVEEKPISVMQMFLKVNGNEAPQLVMNPKGHPYPANLIPLPGCICDAKDGYDEHDAWEHCSKVAEMCCEGLSHQVNLPKRNALVNHLCDACSILDDLQLMMADEIAIGSKTIYAILSRIKWFVLAAGKCVDLDLGSTDE